MVGRTPCCIRHSIMADEQGAQHVWSKTSLAPPGTSNSNFFFFIVISLLILRPSLPPLSAFAAKQREQELRNVHSMLTDSLQAGQGRRSQGEIHLALILLSQLADEHSPLLHGTDYLGSVRRIQSGALHNGTGRHRLLSDAAKHHRLVQRNPVRIHQLRLQRSQRLKQVPHYTNTFYLFHLLFFPKYSNGSYVPDCKITKNSPTAQTNIRRQVRQPYTVCLPASFYSLYLMVHLLCPVGCPTYGRPVQPFHLGAFPAACLNYRLNKQIHVRLVGTIHVRSHASYRYIIE